MKNCLLKLLMLSRSISFEAWNPRESFSSYPVCGQERINEDTVDMKDKAGRGGVRGATDLYDHLDIGTGQGFSIPIKSKSHQTLSEAMRWIIA